MFGLQDILNPEEHQFLTQVLRYTKAASALSQVEQVLGKTEELSNVTNALLGHIDTLQTLKIPIPEETSALVRDNIVYLANNGDSKATLPLVRDAVRLNLYNQ